MGYNIFPPAPKTNLEASNKSAFCYAGLFIIHVCVDAGAGSVSSFVFCVFIFRVEVRLNQDVRRGSL